MNKTLVEKICNLIQKYEYENSIERCDRTKREKQNYINDLRNLLN